MLAFLAAVFKILDGTFVLFCRFHAIEGSQVSSFSRLRIFLSRIDAELS